MEVKLLASYPDESIAYRASGICIGKQGSEKGMKSALSQGHESIIEHLPCTFELNGVSRALTHQLVRHRIASFSQESQRYVDYKVPVDIMNKVLQTFKDFFKGYDYDCSEIYELEEKYFVTPPKIKEDLIPYMWFMRSCCKSLFDYNLILGKYLNIPAEDTRYILPNAFKTNIVTTVNTRVLLGIGNERLCEQAQWEIREAVGLMKECIKDVYPTIYNMMNPKCFKSRCKETRPCSRKVMSKSEQIEIAKLRG